MLKRVSLCNNNNSSGTESDSLEMYTVHQAVAIQSLSCHKLANELFMLSVLSFWKKIINQEAEYIFWYQDLKFK